MKEKYFLFNIEDKVQECDATMTNKAILPGPKNYLVTV
jgi:hypothetical protein